MIRCDESQCDAKHDNARKVYDERKPNAPVLRSKHQINRPGRVDAETNALIVDVDDSEFARRKASWTMEKETPNRGVLAEYARLVSSASLGAVTDSD